MNDRTKKLTERTKKFLDSGEGYTIEFKETLESIKIEDLIAFANAEKGGTILIGVKELEADNGLQKAKIVGHAIGDEQKLTILNKINASANPPFKVNISFENTEHQPIIVIDIPSSENKPHCDNKGRYTIRDDARNRGIKPEEMLEILLNVEEKKFLSRFKNATYEYEEFMKSTQENVDEVLGNIKRLHHDFEQQIDVLSETTQKILTNVGQMIDEVESQTQSTIGEIQDNQIDINRLRYKLEKLEENLKENMNQKNEYLIDYLKSIIEYLDIDDPHYQNQLKNAEKLIQEDRFSTMDYETFSDKFHSMFPLLSSEDLKQLYEKLSA